MSLQSLIVDGLKKVFLLFEVKRFLTPLFLYESKGKVESRAQAML